MDRRKCETCRYFEENELQGCGWCNHPQRRTTVDTLIVVRKGELACRNGWDNDLWEPVDERGRVTRGQAPATPPANGQREEPAAVVTDWTRRRETTERVAEDVVVGQSPVMPTLNERAALLAFDPRLAIDEARERHRRRMSANGSELAQPEPVAPAEAPAERAVPSAETPVADDVAADRASIVHVGDYGSSAQCIADDPFDDIPECRDGVDLPRPCRPASPPVVPVSPSADAEAESAALAEPWFANGDPRRARLLSEVLAQRAQAERHGRGRFGRRRQPPPPEPPAPAETTDVPEDDILETAQPGEQQYVLLREPPAPETRRWSRWADEAPAEREPDDRLVEPMRAEAVPEDWDRPREALPELEDDDDELTIPTVDIAPDVPRICRTCRDFRPSDSGDRGWCTNKWAFTHRRMVNADELPCLTSLGCWWLPHDVIWLSTTDASRHGEPTPLVDRWLAERTAAEEASRPAMRRRQS